MSGIITILVWLALVTPAKSNTKSSHSPVLVVKAFFSPLLLPATPASSVLNITLVPIGAEVQILAVIVDFVEKSKAVLTVVTTPAYVCPPFLMILAKLVLEFPVVWGAATASTVIPAPSNPAQSLVTGLVSKSKGKS